VSRRVIDLVVVPVPARSRLRATLAECARLVDAMPDPMCEAIEQARVLELLREQLGTLANVGERVTQAGGLLRQAQAAAAAVGPVLRAVQAVRGRRR
jgi:hypothetical protein